jgi:hypothetical protein
MQKIMFNDRYGLTDAVIDYIKNNTRRIEGGEQFQRAATSAEDFTYEEATGCIVMCCQGIEIFRHKCRYKVGEVVAVAQSYYHAFSPRCDIPVYGADRTPGWRNKLFVRADLMPHQICITGIKSERLQSISHDDAMREGIYMDGGDDSYMPHYFYDYPNNPSEGFDTPREAFAALVDKVYGRGTWDRNPWVVVYEFELVK